MMSMSFARAAFGLLLLIGTDRTAANRDDDDDDWVCHPPSCDPTFDKCPSYCGSAWDCGHQKCFECRTKKGIICPHLPLPPRPPPPPYPNPPPNLPPPKSPPPPLTPKPAPPPAPPTIPSPSPPFFPPAIGMIPPSSPPPPSPQPPYVVPPPLPKGMHYSDSVFAMYKAFQSELHAPQSPPPPAPPVEPGLFFGPEHGEITKENAYKHEIEFGKIAVLFVAFLSIVAVITIICYYVCCSEDDDPAAMYKRRVQSYMEGLRKREAVFGKTEEDIDYGIGAGPKSKLKNSNRCSDEESGRSTKSKKGKKAESGRYAKVGPEDSVAGETARAFGTSDGASDLG